ncbi:MAG: Acetyltransferase, partial [Oscillospiraceae bacterium]|nr:Acetyltransferase [Oscillospiraceae bacterium]
PDYALMAGVPAKQIGWACECGQVLDSRLKCNECGKEYVFCNQTIAQK